MTDEKRLEQSAVQLVQQFWVSAIATLFALAVGTLIWSNVHLLSRWTQLFVDREHATEACLTASTIEVGLPDIPSFPVFGAQVGDLQWFLQNNARSSAISSRRAVTLQREIRMIVAAEASRDLELAKAAAIGAPRLVTACRQKGYPLG